MKIHITLVGGQPAPVYNGIIATGPDKVVYVYSDSQDSRRSVEKVKAEVNLPFEDVASLDTTDPQQIQECAELLAKKYKDDEVTLNISSGLKSWSHLFGRVFEQMPNAAVVYMDQNNVLWNYKTMQGQDNFAFNMHVLFRLYGNSLDNNYTPYKDYTEEDRKAIKVIEEMRKFNTTEFNTLTTALDPKRNNILKNQQRGSFENSPSFVEWEKASKSQDGYVRLCLYHRNGWLHKECELESKHIVDLVFNAGWFEYKVATMLSTWERATEVCLNCHFPFKEKVDKNEVDIVVNTGRKILFVECKTQITHTTDIDKFRSVIKTYGGMGSKGIFITDASMSEEARHKCEEHSILTFSLKDTHLNLSPEKALHFLLDTELFNINAR